MSNATQIMASNNHGISFDAFPFFSSYKNTASTNVIIINLLYLIWRINIIGCKFMYTG